LTNKFSDSFEKKLEDTTKLGLEVVRESSEENLMTLSVGPQHPGSGHFNL
jgi:NADH-quinone oxidoreductase subunit D